MSLARNVERERELIYREKESERDTEREKKRER